MNIRVFTPFTLALAVWVGVSSGASADDVVFNAKIGGITMARKFDGKTIVTGVDPRFVVRLILDQDAEGIGKRGDSISFAIHSPARDLGITDQGKAVGTLLHLKLGDSGEGGIRSLRRVVEDKAKPATQSGDAKPPTSPSPARDPDQ